MKIKNAIYRCDACEKECDGAHKMEFRATWSDTFVEDFEICGDCLKIVSKRNVINWFKGLIKIGLRKKWE